MSRPHLTGVDDEFVHIFGRRRGGKPLARAAAPVTEDDESTPDGSARLQPAERKVASAARSHARAVDFLVNTSTQCRDVAMSGLAALADAERVATPSPRASAGGVSVSGGGGSESGGVADATLSLEGAFDAAVAMESRGSEAAVGDRLRAWQVVFDKATLALGGGSAAGAVCSVESARRAQLSALTHTSSIYAEVGETRKAIGALERVLALSDALEKDATLLRSLSSIAHRLAKLHSTVGGIDATVKYLVLEKTFGKDASQLDGGAVPVAPAPSAPAAPAMVSTPAPATATGKVDESTDALKSRASKAAPTSAPVPPAPQPAALPQSQLAAAPPSEPESSVSLFSAAAQSAMVRAPRVSRLLLFAALSESPPHFPSPPLTSLRATSRLFFLCSTVRLLAMQSRARRCCRPPRRWAP